MRRFSLSLQGGKSGKPGKASGKGSCRKGRLPWVKWDCGELSSGGLLVQTGGGAGTAGADKRGAEPAAPWKLQLTPRGSDQVPDGRCWIWSPSS